MSATMMFDQIANYPVEERVRMVDTIVESLNGCTPEIESAWNALSCGRLSELRSGRVKGTPASTVFARARKLCGR